MLAVAGGPGGASLEVTVLVVLICTPIAVPVTFTEKVHDAPAVRVAPAKLMLFEPSVAVMVPASHEPARPLGVETINPDGSVSVKERPVSETGFGLVSVKLKVVVLLGPNN